MDSRKLATELESESKRLKEGDQLTEDFSNKKIPKIEKVSDTSYRLIERVRTMEEYLKSNDGVGSRKDKAEEKYRRLEAEKRNLALDLEVVSRNCDEAQRKFQAAEAEIEALKNMLERRDGKIMELGREKMKITEELQDWVLQMEEGVNIFTTASGIKDLQNSENAGGKKRLEENEQVKVDVFLQRIRVSGKGKGEMEAEDCMLERDVSREKEKVLCNNAALEAKEKKIAELLQRIEVLEKENAANHANRVKSEFERNLKEEQEKENLELVRRIGILEKEKGDLEDEIKQKDEVIQVLGQENDSLENKIKELRMGISKRAVKLERDVELPQQMHLAKDGWTSGTPTLSQDAAMAEVQTASTTLLDEREEVSRKAAQLQQDHDAAMAEAARLAEENAALKDELAREKENAKVEAEHFQLRLKNEVAEKVKEVGQGQAEAIKAARTEAVKTFVQSSRMNSWVGYYNRYRAQLLLAGVKKVVPDFVFRTELVSEWPSLPPPYVCPEVGFFADDGPDPLDAWDVTAVRPSMAFSPGFNMQMLPDPCTIINQQMREWMDARRRVAPETPARRTRTEAGPEQQPPARRTHTEAGPSSSTLPS